MEGFDEWLAGERERAEWRRLQGTPLPTDDEILNGPKPPEDAAGREEWMTKLPPQMRPRAGHRPVTSRRSRRPDVRRAGRVDDRGLDRHPQGRRHPRSQALPGGAGEDVLAAGGEGRARRRARAGERETGGRVQRETSAEEFAGAAPGEGGEGEQDARARAKAEKKARDAKAASVRKKRKKGEEGGDGTGWEYRPWNRDTDLEAGRQSTKKLNPEEMMKNPLSTR